LDDCLSTLREIINANTHHHNGILKQSVFLRTCGNEDFQRKKKELDPILKDCYGMSLPPTSIIGQAPEEKKQVALELLVTLLAERLHGFAGGLQIGDGLIRYCEFERGGKVTKQIPLRLPPGVVVGGKVADKEALQTSELIRYIADVIGARPPFKTPEFLKPIMRCLYHTACSFDRD